MSRTALTIMVWVSVIVFLWALTEIVITLVTGAPGHSAEFDNLATFGVIGTLAWELRERKFGPRCPNCGGFHDRKREEVDS